MLGVPLFLWGIELNLVYLRQGLVGKDACLVVITLGEDIPASGKEIVDLGKILWFLTRGRGFSDCVDFHLLLNESHLQSRCNIFMLDQFAGKSLVLVLQYPVFQRELGKLYF